MSTAPDECHMPYRVQWGLKIPLRDGVLLDATVIRPATGGPVPVVFRLTPYTTDRFADGGTYFARAGFAFVCADVRGRGNSGGEFVLWTREGQDGADAVEFLARQPWCDGRVVTWGGSYSGKNQWMIAGERPAGLAAIAPACSGVVGANIGMHHCNIFLTRDHTWLVFMRGKTGNSHAFTDAPYWRGAALEAARGAVAFRDFDTLAGYPSAIWQEWMDHPMLDAFWDAASPDAACYAGIDVPVLAITGLYDSSQTGTIAFRQQHLDAVGEGAASYLVIGPWDHGGTGEPRRHLGGLDFGADAVVDVLALHVGFYDHALNGAPLPPFLADRVVYFLAGANQWRAAPSLASATARVETRLLSSPDSGADSLARRGALVAEAPPQPPDCYRYDPSLPAHNEGWEGGILVGADYLTSDAMLRRIDGDGLIYDTEPLAAPADLVGTPVLELWLAMDVADTDIRAALYEVRADGGVVFLAQDLLRARHRRSRRAEEPVPAGVVQHYVFERFNFVARRVAAGSAVRLLIVPLGAGCHAQRNRNSGRPVAEETAADNRVADVSVVLGPQGSRLHIPWGAG